jgi:plastocyanin
MSLPLRSNRAWIVMAIVAVLGCKSSTDPNQQSPSDVTITLGAMNKGNLAFSPATLTISLATKTKVTWRNADYDPSVYGATGVAHTVTADGGAFGSGQIAARSLFAVTFTTPGTYGYHCSNHPTMVATIIVNP